MPQISDEGDAQTRTSYLPRAVYFLLATNFALEFVLIGLKGTITSFLMHFAFSNNFIFQVHKYLLIEPFLPLVFAIMANFWFGTVKVIFALLTSAIAGSALLFLASFSMTGSEYLALPGIFLLFSAANGVSVCLIGLSMDQIHSVNGSAQKICKYFCIWLLLEKCADFFGALLFAIIRQASCYWSSCYPLQQGIGLIITLTALGIFYFGDYNTKYIRRKPDAEKFDQMFHSTIHAIRRSKREDGEINPSHILDYAQDKYDSEVTSETKKLFCVLILFIPAALYFMFARQKTDIWASRKFRDEYFYLLIVELIIQVVFLIGYLLTPEISWLTLPWKKMGTGGALVGISYGLAGYVELYQEGTDVSVSFWIQVPQTLFFASGSLLFTVGGACLIFAQGPKSLTASLYGLWNLLPFYPGGFLFWTGWKYPGYGASYLIFIYATLIWGVVALLVWLAYRFPFPKIPSTTQISSMELANMDQNTVDMGS